MDDQEGIEIAAPDGVAVADNTNTNAATAGVDLENASPGAGAGAGDTNNNVHRLMDTANANALSSNDTNNNASLSSSQPFYKRTSFKLVLGMLLLLGGVVGLVVGLVTRNNNNSNSNSKINDEEMKSKGAPDADADADTTPTPTPAPSIPTELLEPSPTPAPIPSRASLELADDTPFPTFSRYAGGGAAGGGDGSSQYPTYNYNYNYQAETLIPVPPEPDTLTPLVVTRFTNNCNYVVLDHSAGGGSSSSSSSGSGTVNVSVPSYNTTLSQALKDAGETYANNNNINDGDGGTVNFLYDTINTNGSSVAKMLAGGASAFDNGTAIIVSYNSLGTEGGVWAITNSNSQNYHEQSAAAATSSLQTLDSDQLGWDVAISSSTYVAGAPGYNGTWIPLIGDWYWAGRGVAYVMTRRNNKENEKQQGGGGGVVVEETTTTMIGEGGIEWEVEEGTTSGSGSEKEGGEEKEEDWYQEGILIPSVADDNSDFGSSVDIAECECLIVVGAWHDRDSRGSAFIFSKDDNNEWTQLQKLAPDDTRRSQSDYFHGNFGYTVAISNNYVAVKAPYDSYTGSYDYYDPNRGVVYVYQRESDNDGGNFTQINRLYTPEGPQLPGHFTDIIFLDDFLLVGAPGKNKVYVFEEVDSTIGYEKTAELTPSYEVGPDSSFGISLDGNGANSVLVGDRGGEKSYLFSFMDGVWKERAMFDGFNTAVSGDMIVEHSPKSFEMNGDEYGGEVNFYNLECGE